MTAFIAYYRVSTDRQGASGLGLEAQRSAVAAHIGTGKLMTEYTEVESGKKHTNRPQLLAALQECRRKKVTLVIAKLDRLGACPRKNKQACEICGTMKIKAAIMFHGERLSLLPAGSRFTASTELA